MSLGFSQAGLGPRISADIDEDACSTYRANIGNKVFNVDLSESSNDFNRALEGHANAFALIGGPPCQGFSSAGLKNGQDKRNRLIFNYFSIVERVRPRWFLFENVEGLLTANSGSSVAGLVREFIRIGYKTRLEKVNFAAYGLPQARKRVILVGNVLGVDFGLPLARFSFNAGKHKCGGLLPSAPTLDNALAGLGVPGTTAGEITSYATRKPTTEYDALMREVPDFDTYLDCLCELHKRRRKYERILSAQPLPTMLQVSPRSLLEFGIIATPALASWLAWRKWFYDIDNRAAQETGYLFEPILASALGGQPYGARTSPIKRVADNNKGRQVDCIVNGDAYEFKLRVTIAASGQGRFSEELDFARDCRESGFNPILLVIDSTPSARLDDLRAQYQRFGGGAYVGDEAWQHLEQEAGPTMATLIDKYVHRPIAMLDEHIMELLDLYVSAERDRSALPFKMGRGAVVHEWTIPRAENPALAEDTDDTAE